MKFRTKRILLWLLIFLSLSNINAQKERSLPKDEDSWGYIETCLVVLNVSVQSSKKGFLKDLTYKDFKIYDDKKLKEIEFFKLDELKNQYLVGFYPKDCVLGDKWHDVKVKLLNKKKKNYGKISVKAQDGYYSGNPKSKI